MANNFFEIIKASAAIHCSGGFVLILFIIKMFMHTFLTLYFITATEHVVLKIKKQESKLRIFILN